MSFSKPTAPPGANDPPSFFAKECKEKKVIIMPLPSTLISGDKRAKPFKRDTIQFKGPEIFQNETIENLQAGLTGLAFCNCCSKAKFNSCLLSAFTTEGGDFDFIEAKKCFIHYYHQYCNLNLAEWKIWCYEEFVKCCYGLDDNGNIINGFDLSYGSLLQKKKVRVCRKVWSYFMGKQCTKHRLQVFADSYKTELSPEGSSLTSRQNYGDATMHGTNLREIHEFYIEAGLENDNKDMMKMGIIRRTQMETFLWFRDHFELVGDPQPNIQQVHLDLIEKTEIYQMYVNEIGKANALSFSSWRKFWAEVFPEVTIREWKNVTGKCRNCGYINGGRRTAKSPAEIAAFRKLHILHKSGLFMMERLTYHLRRAEAEIDDTVFSGIIDVMDNTHCQCPYEANQNTFPNAINQLICGFLQHSKEKQFTIYRGTGDFLLLYL